jgi:hypothetical protein
MFFDDINDLKLHISVNVSMDFNEFRVALYEVDRTVLKKYLGKDFFNQLQGLYNDKKSNPLTGNTLELIRILKSCTANFALAKWVPLGQVNIDTTGIRIASTENNKTAFQWQVNQVVDTCNENGFQALDEALIFLADNIVDFEVYQSSEEFKQNASLFLSSAKEFCRFYSPMSNSPVQFLKMRSIISKVEDFYIKAVLLPDLYQDLKTKISSGTTLSDEEKKLIALIKPAVAHLTIAKATYELSASINANGFLVFDNTAARDVLDNKKTAGTELIRISNAAEEDGRTYLSLLKSFLTDNKADYSLYTSDAKYLEATTLIDTNDGTKTFFSAI